MPLPVRLARYDALIDVLVEALLREMEATAGVETTSADARQSDDIETTETQRRKQQADESKAALCSHLP